MDRNIYIDLGRTDGPTGILFGDPDSKAVYTGLEIHTEKDCPELEEAERRCGLTFFRPGAPVPDLYGVPCITAFASDQDGGIYAGAGDPAHGPIVRIGPDLTIAPAADSLEQLLRGPACAPARLALPLRVFPSREAAEREFPIQDLWTVLRRSKEPRFQVWTMMSPADRAGKAHVHYTAWQEAYTGIMDPRVLAWNTPERCREMAEKYPQNTLVLLDQAQDDRVAGFACYLRRARPFISVPDSGEVTALYVLKEYQGLGLGRLLMERCLACLPRPRAALMVLKGNDRAIGFYGHMGFRLTGREQTSRLNGGEITELEMVLERTE